MREVVSLELANNPCGNDESKGIKRRLWPEVDEYTDCTCPCLKQMHTCNSNIDSYNT
jgi:hypothetical protein